MKLGPEPPRYCAYMACPRPDEPLTGRRDRLRHDECKMLERDARRAGLVHHRALEAFVDAIAHVRGRRTDGPAARMRARARPMTA